jgi:aldehyde reductase
LTAYGPLGLPYIFTKSLPYTNKTIKKAVLLDDPIVKKIAAKYKKTSAQILIRFQVILLLNNNNINKFSYCN